MAVVFVLSSFPWLLSSVSLYVTFTRAWLIALSHFGSRKQLTISLPSFHDYLFKNFHFLTFFSHKRQKGGGKGMSQFEERRRQRSRRTRQERVRRQRLHVRARRGTCRKTADAMRRMRFEVGRGGALFREWMRPHVEHRVECAGRSGQCMCQKESRKICTGIDSCAAVWQCSRKKWWKMIPCERTPGEAKRYRQARTPTVHRCPLRGEAVGGSFHLTTRHSSIRHEHAARMRARRFTKSLNKAA